MPERQNRVGLQTFWQTRKVCQSVCIELDNLFNSYFYNFYLNQYNSIFNTYPLYQDKIETYRDIMETYYNIVNVYEPLSDLISNDSAYDDFRTSASTLYSTYVSATNDFFLIKDDLEYWALQMSAIQAFMNPYDTLREMIVNTENLPLYKSALSIIINDLQNMVLSEQDIDMSSLSLLVTYIANHQDMYGCIDLSGLFSIIDSEGLMTTFEGIFAIINLNFSSVDSEDMITLESALNALMNDYVDSLDISPTEEEQKLLELEIITDHLIHDFDTVFQEIQNLILSITTDEYDEIEILISNKSSLTLDAYTIELAKVIDNIMSDDTFDVSNFVNAYLYINFFQVDVNVDISLLPTVETDVIARMESFLNDAHTISITPVSELSETILSDFYNEWLDWQHDFLNSYLFYLD